MTVSVNDSALASTTPQRSPSPEAKRPPSTPDVVLSFVDTMRRGAQGFWWGLFADRRKLADTRICAFGETCAFGMDCETEYEKVRRVNREKPASHEGRIHWYDQSQPVRPTTFTSCRQEFPLAGTRAIVKCPPCDYGKITCGGCGGRGHVTCFSCGGSGRSSAQGNPPCGNCGGSGQVRHGACNGTGKVKCQRCDGEGHLVQYQVEVFEWYSARDHDLVVHGDADRTCVRRKAKATLEQPGAHFGLSTMNVEEVSRALGVRNGDIEAATEAAGGAYQRMLTKALSREGRVLFQQTGRAVTPVSYLNAKTGGRYGQFWAVGTRDAHHCIRPPLPVDPVKLAAWAGVAVAVGLGIATLVDPALLPEWAWTAAAGPAAALGVWGAFRRPASGQDRVVVILGDDSAETSAIFGLIPSVLCASERAETPDECDDLIFRLASGEASRAGLSASCRLIPSGGDHNSRGVRLILVSSASMATPGPALKGIMASADVVLLRCAHASEAGAALGRHSAVLALCASEPRAPIVRTVVTGDGEGPAGRQEAETDSAALKLVQAHFDLASAQAAFRKGSVTRDLASSVVGLLAGASNDHKQVEESNP